MAARAGLIGRDTGIGPDTALIVSRALSSVNDSLWLAAAARLHRPISPADSGASAMVAPSAYDRRGSEIPGTLPQAPVKRAPLARWVWATGPTSATLRGTIWAEQIKLARATPRDLNAEKSASAESANHGCGE